MAKWNKPEIEELGIEATEHKWIGIYRDGGYIGDGEISGHLSWEKPSQSESGSDSENELS